MDSVYKEFPLIFNSVGIAARAVDDLLPPNSMLNADNCEELAEGAWAQRLGSVVLNSTGVLGGAVYPLSGKVVSVGKLGNLFGNYSRYAVTADGKLWRRNFLTAGSYTQISTGFSGNPVSMQSYTNSDFTSANYEFFADANGFFKDNGTFAAPQQGGIFAPQQPVQAQSQKPSEIILDTFRASTYTTSGIGSFTDNTVINSCNTSSAVTATGIQEVNATGFVNGFAIFQSVVIDSGSNAETVLILLVTPTGFIASFTKTHASGVTVQQFGWSGTVAASATGVVSNAFSGTPVAAWPTTLQQADYIGIQLYVSDPTQVQSIQLAFTLADGSTFYKVVAQGPLQNLLTTASTSSTAATTAATDALLDDSLGLYGNSAGSIGELNTGGGWTALLFQLSDFAGSGKADFNDPVDNWSNITGYSVTIVANDNAAPVLIEVGSLVLVGGAGSDSFAGVGYDYVWTFLNPVDGTESNPSPLMTNQNPPNQTNWVYPRRQPVLLNMNVTTYGPAGQLQDTQIGYLRIYRRGGTLGDNFRRVDQITVNISAGGVVQYTDTTPDYQLAGAPFVSFTNDVPVPSLLPVPVNTTLQNAINSVGAVVTVTPVSMANISVRQEVTLGNPTAIQNNFETVIVLTVGGSSFTAFVQNTHAVGEAVQASIKVGQPLYGMVIAFNKAWYWGDPNNPSTLYFSTGNAPQYVGEANNVIVSTPDDIITAVVPFAGNVFVSCVKSGWWMIPPDTPASQAPYPTKCKFGCIASFGYVATEEMIVYQSIDGIRAFAGGASEYLTQMVEFIWQGVGSTPIVEANQAMLSQTVMAYWNNQIFVSYIGTDGNRHRLIFHTQYRRWRNDDFDCQSIFLESDTNLLIVGDSNGLVHIDRQDIGYDQINSSGVLAKGPISINLQTAYSFGESPNRQKNYANLQVDANTAGQDLTLTLLFDDGEELIILGTINTTERQKVNFPIENGDGFQAYKVSLQVSGNLTSQAFLYQCAIESLTLPVTRKSIDTYFLRLGIEDSKFAKNIWWEYSASAPIVCLVYYDDNPTAGFTFTLPTNTGIRNHLRQRLPALSFRDIRIVGYSTGDFMVWSDSKLEFKPQGTGKGYQTAEFVMN